MPNNGGAGVFIQGGASHNTVGGTTAAARNVISGNNSETSGVAIDSPSNLVEGNYIGTDSTGKNAVGNGEGVFLGPGATGNTIGGTTAATRNIISANNSYGVQIYNTSNNVVEGDFIGTDVSGTLPLGNNEYGYGVFIYGSTGNTIGGTATGAGDVISGNTSYGVFINSSTGNLVEGDLIGMTAAGIARWATAATASFSSSPRRTRSAERPPPRATSSRPTAAPGSSSRSPPRTWSKEIISAPTSPARRPFPAPTHWAISRTASSSIWHPPATPSPGRPRHRPSSPATGTSAS